MCLVTVLQTSVVGPPSLVTSAALYLISTIAIHQKLTFRSAYLQQAIAGIMHDVIAISSQAAEAAI